MEIQATRSVGDGLVPNASDSAVALGRRQPTGTRPHKATSGPKAGVGDPASALVTARRSVTPAQNRVAQSLLVDGPASAVELAERLNVTPAGIRRHIDSLASDGFVSGGDRPAYGPSPSRGRGRPPRIYSLTDEGRDVFDQAYDDLAVAALRFLEDQIGSNGVEEFAEQRGREFEQRYLPLVGAAGPERSDRIEALAAGLTEDGFAATVVREGSAAGFQICQHNCPVAHVAEQFPVLCEKETEAMQRLLGGTVTRLATIAHGDGVCTAMVMGQPATGPKAQASPGTNAAAGLLPTAHPGTQLVGGQHTDRTVPGRGNGSR